MRYLFIHQNFPGQYLHLVRALVAQAAHDVVFISEPNDNVIPGVRKFTYRRPPPPDPAVHWTIREFDTAMRRAEIVAGAAHQLRALGYRPDIILGHQGWGELLNLRDVWPDVPVLGYLEFYYQVHGADVNFDPEFPVAEAEFARVRAKNAINHLALAQDFSAQTPTAWQRSTYPAWARERIALLPEGVDLGLFRPDAARAPFTIGPWHVAPSEKLVTYVARDLEPYRGVHPMLRALPAILSARPDVRCVMVGGDGVSYGPPPVGTTWKAYFLDQLGPSLDRQRVLFPGRVDYDMYRALLARSDAHVYLTYPFVASWSLREALAAGCAVIGSDTEPVREFIGHEENGLLASFFDPSAIADAVLRVLADASLAARLSAAARARAERTLSMDAYLADYRALIGRCIAG